MDPEVLETLKNAKEEPNCDAVDLDNLDIGTFTPEFVEALSQLESLQDLSMNTCKISSLKGFPTGLPLSRLELNENGFPGKDLQYLVGLETLSLTTNNIATYEELEPLRKLQKLAQLDLSENPIASKPDYRKKVFEMFANLDILDNKDVDDNSIVYGDAEGGEEGSELSEGDEVD